MTPRRRQMLVVVVMFVALVAATARPAAAAAACSVLGTVLTINGTNAAEAMTISDTGALVTVTGGCTLAPAAAFIETVNITLLGGADTVTYALTAAFAGAARQRNLVVQLGGGGTSGSPQTFTFSQAGTVTINSFSNISLLVVGGSGVDQITVNLNGALHASRVNVVEVLGAGVDTSTVTISHAGEDATVDFDVDLGEGNNTSTLTVVEAHDAAAVDFNLTGGSRIDTANLNLNGDWSGRSLSYTARLNAGADTFTGTLGAAFALTQGPVRIDVDGGAGADTLDLVDVAGATMIDGYGGFGFPSVLEARLNGGLGIDDMTVDLANTDVQGGDSVHGLRLRVNGGAGADTISVDVSDPSDVDGNYDIAIRGDDGNDNITLTFVPDDLGGNFFGPDGKMLIDGGLGTADVITSVVSSTILRTQ